MCFLPYLQSGLPGFRGGTLQPSWQSPLLCIGCAKQIGHCTIAHKYIYNTHFADCKYHEKLCSSRSGINMTKQELRKKDRIISSLIEQGQSPLSYPDKLFGAGHVCANHVLLSWPGSVYRKKH